MFTSLAAFQGCWKEGLCEGSCQLSEAAVFC